MEEHRCQCVQTLEVRISIQIRRQCNDRAAHQVVGQLAGGSGETSWVSINRCRAQSSSAGSRAGFGRGRFRLNRAICSRRARISRTVALRLRKNNSTADWPTAFDRELSVLGHWCPFFAKPLAGLPGLRPFHILPADFGGLSASGADHSPLFYYIDHVVRQHGI